MATNKLSKPQRTVSISDESYDESEPMMTTNENEFKPIPFLRRLVDMLRENDEVISFYPGEVKKGGKVTLGRILVHDRIKVEADILPRYFNHSSFASLRRQLNYFCFTRLGKGRQRGATYCNEGVVVLDDILRLKRRSTTVGAAREAAAAAAAAQQQTMLSQAATNKGKAGGHSRSVSDSSISTTTEESSTPSSRSAKKRLSNSNKQNSSSPTLISPRSSPIHTCGGGDNSVPQITLDLTIPPPAPHRIGESPSSCCTSSYATLDDYYSIGNTPVVVGARITAAASDHDDSENDDADVLAGCKALLSIRSLGPEELAAAF